MADFEEVQQHQWAQAGRELNTKLAGILQSPFSGIVNDSGVDRLVALEAARDEYKTIDLTNKLVFWTDASHLMKLGTTGIAYVWKDRHYDATWKSRQYFVEGAFGSSEGELFAISEAIKVATQLTRESTLRPPEEDVRISTVYVYSDAVGVLQWIRDFHIRNPSRFPRHVEMARLKERAQILKDLGVRLELHWVKGHAEIEGNQLADKLAGEAARSRPNVEDEGRIEVLVPSADGQIVLAKKNKGTTRKQGPKSTRIARKLSHAAKQIARAARRARKSKRFDKLDLEVDGLEIVPK